MVSLNKEKLDCDVCVIGGGLAGICAAIASARNGAKTLLMHDRPVLGGNASSEIRMWICGAQHSHHPDGKVAKYNKETGILEEIQLANLYRNPGLNYSIWDSILWEKVKFQPNLTTLLNTSCLDAETEDNHITQIRGWQLTTQTWFTVKAKNFIDCSGDSILAALVPAACRQGREAGSEFGEDIAPATADKRVMGSSLLIQTYQSNKPQPFTAPKWAYKFNTPEDLKFRMNGIKAGNFWWLEVGGINDTIKDGEFIRDELTKIAYGIWDYIKNRAPQREKAENWAAYWIGSLPGKRENRRYEGDHIMTQRDIEAGGKFKDTVGYGGWTMDDHHPAGLLYPEQPSNHHVVPEVYGIPYRSLYSRNIDNLLFAGRNISVTHAALSSTRVMGTCAVIGQAAGTAAALCHIHSCTPRDIYEHHLPQLQNILMEDDCFLPEFRKPIGELAQQAKIDGDGQGLENLLDGMDRDRKDENHGWEGQANDKIQFTWKNQVNIGGLRITFDSDLNHRKRMPCGYPVSADRNALPGCLVKSFRVEVMDHSGDWQTIFRETENIKRLVYVPIKANTKSIRLIPESAWADGKVRIMSVEPTAEYVNKIPEVPEGPSFASVRAEQNPEDLAPPAKESIAPYTFAANA